MFQSASSINQVFELSRKEFIYEEVLKKYFSRKNERDEFRQELWLCIFEKDQDTITNLWNRHEFKYYYINIVNTWVKSNTSKWHKTFRTTKESLPGYLPDIPEENYEELIEEEKEKKKLDSKRIKQINEALLYYEAHDPQFKFEAECFRMNYFQNKPIREIQKKLHNISTYTICKAIQYALLMVKFYIHKHHRK